MIYRLFLCVFGALVAAMAHGAGLESVAIVVEKGESLQSIAQRYLQPPAVRHWTQIAKLNQLKSAPYTIYPGMILRLPMDSFVTQSSPAKWRVVNGDVQVLAQNSVSSIAAIAGQSLAEGARITVAPNASAIFELPDASQVKLLGGAQLVMEESRYYRGKPSVSGGEALTGTRSFTSLLRLIQGEIETRATPATDRAKALRIQTPTTVVGVRGTNFRVSHGLAGSQDGADELTRTEVVEGLVFAALDEKRKAQVPGGYGLRLDPRAAQIPVPVALLDAPNLDNWARQQHAQQLEFPAFASTQGGKNVAAYRVQVASDESMEQLVFNQRFASGQLIRVPTLQDGLHYVTVRAVDPQGLEGKDIKISVAVQARPQPPLLLAPKNDAKLAQGSSVMLAWTAVLGASGYVVQLEQDGQKSIEAKVGNIQYEMRQLAPGAYHWRIATQTISKDGVTRTGPWSVTQAFTVLATPGAASGGLAQDGRSLHLRWESQGVQKYELQLARTGFDAPLKPAEIISHFVVKPELDLPDLEAGKHFIRYRAVQEASAGTSPWSDTMQIDVARDWRGLWFFLAVVLMSSL